VSFDDVSDPRHKPHCKSTTLKVIAVIQKATMIHEEDRVTFRLGNITDEGR